VLHGSNVVHHADRDGTAGRGGSSTSCVTCHPTFRTCGGRMGTR